MALLSLQRLIVTNFRAVQGTVELDFDQPPGLYFVAGRNQLHPRLGANDAGKSTLFSEALSWCLQGRTSRDNRPGADVVNWYANGTGAGVTAEFTIDDVAHTLERYRNPSRLTLDGNPVEQRDIDKILPLSDSALRRTLLIDQFGAMFLSLRPEDKSKIFSETLDLDLWVKAAERAGDRHSNIEERVTNLEKELAVTLATLAHVKEQRDDAVQREEQFEIDRSAQIVVLRAELREATAADRTAMAELNATREVLNRQGDGRGEIELNDYKVTERELIGAIAARQSGQDRLEEDIEEMEIRLSDYTEAKICPECGQEVTEEHIAVKAATLRREITKAKADLDVSAKEITVKEEQLRAIRVAIGGCEVGLVEFHKAQSKVSVAAQVSLNATREMNRVKKLLSDKTEQTNPYTAQCDQLEAQWERLRVARRQERKSLAEAQADAAIYKFWQQGFREIRLEQIDTTLMELEMAANRHAESLGLENWEIQFATERETTSGTVSHKFTVFLFPPGQDKPVAWENYAGGVSQRWQLAVTHALAEILLGRAGIDTDFEVLDEPTVHMSQEGIEDMIECLRERAKTLNRRVYLIDHHALPLGSFDGIITVQKGVDGVVTVS